MKQKRFTYITFNFSELWFISVLDNQKVLQNTFQTTTFNVEENSRTFLRLYETLKTVKLFQNNHHYSFLKKQVQSKTKVVQVPKILLF